MIEHTLQRRLTQKLLSELKKGRMDDVLLRNFSVFLRVLLPR